MNTLVLDTRYGPMSCLRWGNPEGRAVYAFHGWLDNAASFSVVGPLFAEAFPDYQLVAPDFPGHGLSPWLPAGSHYPFSTWVEIITDILRQSEPAWVIAHSMGAAAAVVAAGACPEFYSGLVLLDAVGPWVAPEEDAVRIMRQALLAPVARTRGAGFGRPEEALQARLKVSDGVSPSELDGIVRRNLREEEGVWFWRTDPALRSPSRLRMTEEMVTGFLRQLDIPVLGVWATAGIIPEASFRQRMSCLPQGQLLILDGHHHCHLTPVLATTLVQRMSALIGSGTR